MNQDGKIIINETYDLIKKLEQDHDVKLSAVQKILFSLGPIGVPLSALYGTLRLFVLKQYVKPANEEEAKLVDIEEGHEILYREVIVFKSGRPLFYGLSYIPTERCKNEVLQTLLDEQETIDAIISENNIETIRTIEGLTVINATPLLQELFNTNEDMLKREYTMTQHGTKRLWAKEIYPISYFRDI